MNDLTRCALYFDFYGELLTEKQKEIYDLYYHQDLSLGEISEIRGVSREAVFDLLKRTRKVFAHYESKLNLVQKYQLSRNIIKEITREISNLKHLDEEGNCQAQRELEWEQILLLLQKLDDSW